MGSCNIQAVPPRRCLVLCSCRQHTVGSQAGADVAALLPGLYAGKLLIGIFLLEHNSYQ